MASLRRTSLCLLLAGVATGAANPKSPEMMRRQLDLELKASGVVRQSRKAQAVTIDKARSDDDLFSDQVAGAIQIAATVAKQSHKVVAEPEVAAGAAAADAGEAAAAGAADAAAAGGGAAAG